MKRTFSTLVLTLLVCAAASAASISTTLTVTNATLTLGTSTAVTGPATLTNIGSGSGTFSATSLTVDASGNYSGPFSITLTGGADKITGTLTIPASALSAAISGGALTGSATVTGGAGTYNGATGSFPNLTGSGSLDPTTSAINVSFTGAGTITTGGTPAPTVPAIAAVQDGASNTPNIAQGGFLSVYGTNLAPSSSGGTPFPRPTVSGGVKVTFTPVAGGTGTDVYLVYIGVNQINAILPSTVPVGSYNVTVTNGTVGAPFATQVVANKVGLFTQDQTGRGLAVVQNYISPTAFDVNRLTTGVFNGSTISPAKPGQTMIAYATGLGAYAAGDNSLSPAHDFRSSMKILAVVGGVNVPVDYAGRAGYAGQDQINFTLPADVPTGCAVTLQISVDGKLSVPTSIAIAPDANSSACVMPGFTTEQLQKFDQGGNYTAGAFQITQFALSVPSIGTEKVNSISGGFSQLTGFQLASAAQVNVSVIQSGSCQVIQSTGTGTGTGASTGSLTHLDAGVVTINGPGGSSLTNQALTKTNNSYSLTNIEGFSFPGQVNFSLPAGGYTLNGAGGNDVGTFSTSLTLASPLTVTGDLPATVTRSAGLTLNWTGGNASDLVEIIGSSGTTTGTGSSAVTNTSTFICISTAGQRTFTVPASILSQLPATTTGSLIVASGATPATFTASLKPSGSIDSGSFSSFVGIGGAPAYQ